ncbi:MAG: FAD-dependent oxidoreductase [Patescibacteria group bacterium]|nr:FAD-dependent oxidoreductase [Patescibacteria group bacterium]
MSDSILVYGADWCGDCHRTRALFDQYNVAYTYVNIDEDAAAKAKMLELVDGRNTLPTVVFTDGSIMQEPSNDELLIKLNLRPAADETATPVVPEHDIIIVGAGPAALTAAIYTTREDIETLLFERGVVGGLAAVTDKIDNYPGFPDGVAGLTLADDLRKQAERFGAVIELGEVTGLKTQGDKTLVSSTSGDMLARAVLLAVGSDYKKIGVPGELEYYARGVHYCATCDGAFYRDKKIVVVGGGNSAVQEAIFLTRFTTHIDLLVRSKMRASDVLQKDLQKFVDDGKITIHLNTTTDEIVGENNSVNKVVITEDGTKKDLAVDGVFVFVGLEPNSQFLKDTPVELDEIGFIKSDDRMMTSMPGVFVAGDIRAGATMQIASAAGEGATAALKMREYLEGQPHPIQN